MTPAQAGRNAGFPDVALRAHPGYATVVHRTVRRRAALTEVKRANHHPGKDAAGDGTNPPPVG